MNDSRLLMSEELVGQIQGLEDTKVSGLINQLVLFLAEDTKTSYEISGHLRFFQTSESPEVELNFQLLKALEICRQRQELEFVDIKIAHAGILTALDGPFCIDAINLSNIDPDNQICTMGIKFKKISKDII